MFRHSKSDLAGCQTPETRIVIPGTDAGNPQSQSTAHPVEEKLEGTSADARHQSAQCEILTCESFNAVHETVIQQRPAKHRSDRSNQLSTAALNPIWRVRDPMSNREVLGNDKCDHEHHVQYHVEAMRDRRIGWWDRDTDVVIG